MSGVIGRGINICGLNDEVIKFVVRIRVKIVG